LYLIAQVQLFVVICARQCQSVVGVIKTLKNTPPLYVLPPSDAFSGNYRVIKKKNN